MSVPFTFVNGTTADATQVNANFAAVLALTGGTLTGPLILNGAATFNAVATFNFPVTVNAVLTLGSTLSVPSITYPGTEGHNIAFGWDGTALLGHVDGTGAPGRLAAWNSNPTFFGVTMTGLQVNGNAAITGNLNTGGNINTAGSGVTTSGLQVNGNVVITGTTTCSTLNTGGGGVTTANLQVNGSGNLTANLSVNGNLTIGGIGSVGGVQFFNNAGFFYSSSNIRSPSFVSDGPVSATLFAMNGGTGARIQDWGGDWGFTTFATSGGHLLFSPDNGATGFFVIPSGGFSDATLKTNIANSAVDALAAVMAIPVRSFEWNEEGLKRLPANVSSPGSSGDAFVPIGLVAQEVQAHAPDAIRSVPLDDNLLTIDPGKLVPYLLRAIQQLNDRIAALEAKA